jgi:hypothetical protein
MLGRCGTVQSKIIEPQWRVANLTQNIRRRVGKVFKEFVKREDIASGKGQVTTYSARFTVYRVASSVGANHWQLEK